MRDTPPTRPLLDVAQVAEQLHVSPRTVRRMIDAGDLPVVRLGRSIRVAPADVDRLIASRRGNG